MPEPERNGCLGLVIFAIICVCITVIVCVALVVTLG
jgi:hypothetical protein